MVRQTLQQLIHDKNILSWFFLMNFCELKWSSVPFSFFRSISLPLPLQLFYIYLSLLILFLSFLLSCYPFLNFSFLFLYIPLFLSISIPSSLTFLSLSVCLSVCLSSSCIHQLPAIFFIRIWNQAAPSCCSTWVSAQLQLLRYFLSYHKFFGRKQLLKKIEFVESTASRRGERLRHSGRVSTTESQGHGFGPRRCWALLFPPFGHRERRGLEAKKVLIDLWA